MPPHINVFNVVWMLYDEFSAKGMELTDFTETEVNVKNKIDILNNPEFICDILNDEAEETLDFEQPVDQGDLEDSDFDIDDTFTDEELKKEEVPSIPFETRQAVVEYWRSSEKMKHRTLRAVQRRFRFVKSLSQIYLWEKQINKLGDKTHKRHEIQKYVFEKFQDARNKCVNVHDSDLKSWALEKAHSLKAPFKASKHWLRDFKKKYRIVTRKITKVISQKDIYEFDHIANTSKAFLNDVHIFFKDSKFNDNQMFNTDQSGFNREIHSGRTLDFLGSKHVENTAQSIHATTHSYTIMPTISKDGMLLSPLFIVYSEPKGQFGPQVRQKMFQADNIYTVASKSGKMGSKELREYLSEVYFKNTPDETILLVDSWSPFKNKNLIDSVTPPNKTVHVFVMPAKTTHLIQPLDKYGFRVWKNFIRKFSDLVMSEQLKKSICFIETTFLKYSPSHTTSFRLHAMLTCGNIRGMHAHIQKNILDISTIPLISHSM